MYKILNSKKGFTLVELLIVVLVLGTLLAIAIPTHTAILQNSHIRVCKIQQKELVSQAENWCIRNNFNSDFNYKITSDGETATVQSHELPLSADQIYLLETDIHPRLPACPSCGTYYITVTPHHSGIPVVTVRCDGGNDGDIHKADE